jgi:hypothetical protein
MSGNLPSGVTDADIDRAIEIESELPCDWEKFSGICMVCGAGPDDECEIEREQRMAGRRR